MKEEDWKIYQELHKKYEEAQQAYHKAQMHLGGAFSEMARSFNPKALNNMSITEEEEAHERFIKAREKLFSFIKEKTES